MDTHEADLTDVFEQLGAIYELLAGAEERAIERHKQMIEKLDNINDNAGGTYLEIGGVESALKDATDQLKKIVSNTRS